VVGKPIEVGARPRGIKAGLGYVWVANGGEGTVSRIDPKTAASIGQPIKVGANPADLAIGAGAVWTANFDDSTVTEIKP
jgi:virginiamycin B lyase